MSLSTGYQFYLLSLVTGNQHGQTWTLLQKQISFTLYKISVFWTEMDFCRSKDDLKWKHPASEKRSLSQFCLIHVWEFCLFACLHQKTSPIENHHHSRHFLPKTAAVFILLFLLLGLPLFTNVPPTFPQPP